MYVLEGNLPFTAWAYRVRLQATPSPDPLVGAAFYGPYSRLLLAGQPAPWAGGEAPSGTPIRLELDRRDLLTRGGRGRYHAAFLAHDGAGWRLALSWPLEVDLAPLPVYAYAYRLPTGHALVECVTHEEAPEEARLDWAGGQAVQAWDGLRRTRDGSPRFFFLLPPEAEGEVALEVRKGDRLGRARATLPPRPPAAREWETRWRLPPWLPPGRGLQAPVLGALAEVLRGMPGMLPPLAPFEASGEVLEAYARLFGVAREEGEEEGLFRERALALPRGRHTARPHLEAHLRRLAPHAQVTDWLSARLGIRRKLDGSWKLDGSVQLGSGLPGNVEPGYYEILLGDAEPDPLYLVREVHRLRPAGTVPLWRLVRGGGVAAKAAHGGVMELALEGGETLSLAGRRRLDGSWKLNGAAKLRSGMAVGEIPHLI